MLEVSLPESNAAKCEHYLNRLYANQQVKFTQNSIAETYGEILYPSLDKLLSIIALSENDVFLDIGSGNGKAVLQTFLTTPVKKAVGMEIIPALHDKAMQALQQIQFDSPAIFNQREIMFLLGDCLQLSFENVTVVLVNAVCFTQSLIYKIAERVNQAETIHTVITTRPMPFLKNMKLKKIVRIQCSWDAALCYLYGR